MFTPTLFLKPYNHVSCSLPLFMVFAIVMQLGAIFKKKFPIESTFVRCVTLIA
jgi:hypothetical protein